MKSFNKFHHFSIIFKLMIMMCTTLQKFLFNLPYFFTSLDHKSTCSCMLFPVVDVTQTHVQEFSFCACGQTLWEKVAPSIHFSCKFIKCCQRKTFSSFFQLGFPTFFQINSTCRAWSYNLNTKYNQKDGGKQWIKNIDEKLKSTGRINNLERKSVSKRSKQKTQKCYPG